MMETSFAVKQSPLLSPRTADYVAALIRDGDNFDYSKWLSGSERERLRRSRVYERLFPRT